MTKKIDNNTINDSFNEEKQHLEKVINIAKNEYEKIKISKKNLKADIMEKRRYMWNELGAVATDLSSNYEMIAQNHEIAGSELFYDDMTTMSKILEKQMECPYFARIDFKENGYKYGEKIYIGKNGLRDKTNYDIIVCDWRSDIASMYYNYETGLASFVCQNGKIEGDLLLKRQFLIENGKLLNMFDTSVAIEDNFLMSILNSHSTDKMKTIVSTIQKSQNEIIREDTSDILIINGCAGSGKTSIALHRIAYLLYKSREKLSQKNFLIFSPNEIFNTYISGVLPDLGEQNVWQSTFVQFCNNALGGDLTPQSYLE
ncbi:MAG: helicase, partial [Oscillospiraceae bacterium]